MAVSDDGIHFTKTGDSSVLAWILFVRQIRKDFRDPYIWRQNGEWNMILGSQRIIFAHSFIARMI